MHHLFRYHQTLTEEPAGDRGPTADGGPTRSSASLTSPERSIAAIRALVLQTVLRPKADTRVVGFKEIRWYHDDLEEYVAWLREVFPGARFVVNTRDHADVLKSSGGARATSRRTPRTWPAIEQRILALAEQLGDAAYRIHYDDYVADPAVLRGLYEWLGEPWDEDAVREVLPGRHSV